MIFGYCNSLKLKLGLWIDLTNTKRFYNREIVEQNGAQYIKLQCRGHGETPSIEQTRSFIEIVDNFINERPFDLIGVHCTHGFNRTGFLIISYLVERLDCSVEAALSMFAVARPPGIYKQDYINELFSRYEEAEEATEAPELPDWCNEVDYDDTPSGTSSSGRKHKLNDEESTSQQENSNGTLSDDDTSSLGNDTEPKPERGNKPHKKRRRELIIKNPTFMAGVPGISVVSEQPLLGDLQLKVQAMCGWNKSGFPGAQPVSMDRTNLKFIHEQPYRVSWKADGTRYMMLINKRDEIYFFDRNNSCFQVHNLTFLKAGNLLEHLENTLLDGEMVIDKHQGQNIPRFLIYDIIKLGNEEIGRQPFYPDRLRCIKKKIIDPRYEAICRGVINRTEEPFSVRNKDFWDINQAGALLGEKFAKLLSHEPDGLIFQPSRDPYNAGVCPNVLKWKPSDMNSVDFRLKITMESGTGILPRKVGLLFVGGQDHPFGKMNVTKVMKDLDNKIIECTANSIGQWEFMRERTDKTLPNSYKTACAVIESIRTPVTKDILLNFIASYGNRDDADIMPPPATSHIHRAAPQVPREN
ncbi:mRNA-capping enzyme-like [Teleopsis dalmanni]|uniref:mRNA-capping enzyme-like n=1 Tax=Teleopsis dalmanni TaxID=139649 RepID=UPI0018CD742B|nr:mRNA-capping enzyme-like [Teleopsis dalmanni]